MHVTITVAALFAASVLTAGCATASPAAAPRAPVPILDQRDLQGCTWEQIGTISTQERSGVFSPSADELRRDLSRRAANMNADAIIDFKMAQLGAVVGRGASSGGRSPAASRATGVAVRYTSPGCPAGTS